MRKILIIVLVVVLCIVGYGAYAYIADDWRLAPDPGTDVAETDLDPAEVDPAEVEPEIDRTPEPEAEPEPEPALHTGRFELAQGDIVALRLSHIPPEVTPSAETELGLAIFTPDGEGAWYAAIPVGNNQSTGNYDILVRAGDRDFAVTVTVLPFDFVEQNLIVDTGSTTINEASSPAAYSEYREKIPPLFDTYDTERYWRGLFAVPADGRISTEFGTIRYTNGDYSRPRSHNGMDIAAPEGTPVYAPNAGRVVMAERLLNTGNTIVIEHGGGLKSYYFHLSRIDVTPGDMAEKGALIGAIGSTGYSTGPHLHYEMRIGNRPINPSMLFEADAGLYSAEDAEIGPP